MAEGCAVIFAEAIDDLAPHVPERFLSEYTQEQDGDLDPSSLLAWLRQFGLGDWSPIGEESFPFIEPFRVIWQSKNASNEDCDPDFGQLPADAMVGGTLCIDDRPVAILIGERASGETPWSPEALEMFASVAQLRLEIHLVRRKMDRLPVSADAADSSPDSGSETPRSAPAEAPDLSRARRYAKLVATDIRLYNEEAVMLGRRNGDLSERIAEPLGRGKNTFLQRHGDLGTDGIQLLHEAYVQVLAAGDPALLPASLLD